MAFSTTVNTSLLTTYLIRKFIPTLEEELQFQKFTAKASIPAGMGKVARWNLFSSPPANTTALTEGVGVDAADTTTNNIIATITTTGTETTVAEYGEYIRVTELEEFAAVPGSRSELVNRMSHGAALSIDSLVRTQALTTSVDFYASDSAANGGSGTPATPGSMSAAAIIGASTLLRDVSATGFRGVAGHPDGHLACIMDPGAELSLITEGTTGRMTWGEAVTDVPGRIGQEKWVNGYMGSVYGTACYRSQNLTTTTVTVSSDNNFVLADHGLGAVSIKDANPQIYINTASAGDVGNPYRNHHTVAWHAYFAADLLDANRVVRLYTSA